VIRVGSVSIECVRGDIAAQRGIDAVVVRRQPAPHQRRRGGRRDPRRRRAGLYREAAAARAGGDRRGGDHGAHGLPNRHVIHTVGP